MKLNDKILLALIVFALLFAPVAVYAGGPGFDTDVYTWGNDDDDGSGGGDDDDGSGGGDDDDGSGGGDDDDDGGNEIPLDGGLSILGAAGAAYAVKSYRDKKAKNKEEK